MRVAERCWPIRILLGRRIGLINIGCISLNAAIKMAKDTPYREVVFALSRRFPKSADLHTAIFYNQLTLPSAAEPDYDLLALVERFMPEKVSRLPRVAELIGAANLTSNMTEFIARVRHPLLLVRLATCRNPRLSHFKETCNFTAVTDQIDQNLKDLAEERNVRLASLSTRRPSGETKRPSGETKRPPSKPT